MLVQGGEHLRLLHVVGTWPERPTRWEHNRLACRILGR